MNELNIVAYLMEACNDLRGLSACFQRQTGAALWTPEFVYFGVSGDPERPCTTEDDCTRYGAASIGKYKVCPSSCAESMAILAGHKDGTDFKDSYLVATDFPCGRCTEIVTSFAKPRGMRRLYFGTYGKGLRPKETTHGLWMQDAGIEIFNLRDGVAYPVRFPEDARGNLPQRMDVDFFLENTAVHEATEIEDIRDIPAGVKMPVKVRTTDLQEGK